MLQRRAEVVVVVVQSLDPNRLLLPLELSPRCVRQAEEEATMSIPTLVDLAGLLETLQRVFPDRLQHPIARIRKTYEALLDEPLQAVEMRACDLLGGLQRAPAGEDGEEPEETPLLVGEELVAPRDRRPQRQLAGVGVATALQQVETL